MKVDSIPEEILEIQTIFLEEAFPLLQTAEKYLLDFENRHDEASKLEALNEIFRVAHSLKGASAAVELKEVAQFAHEFESLLTLARVQLSVATKDRISLLLECCDALRMYLQELQQDRSSAFKGSAPFVKRIHVELDLIHGKKVEEVAPQATVLPTETAVKEEAPRTNVTSVPALRVSLDKIEKIQELVGELATLRNQILNSLSEPRQLQLVLSLVEKSIREVHDRVLDMKKSSLEGLMQRVNRVVRDTSTKLGKDVRIKWDTCVTEVERSILDAVTDPLFHLARNAVDHGMEMPEDRLSRGKEAHGTLTLKLTVEPNEVVFTLSDNGRGIDPAKVLKKAKEKGLVPEEADQWPKEKCIELIFAPGFSTAEAVTEFSGRGVGLDVVRTNIAMLGGSVRVDSEVGVGSTFHLTVPLLNGLTEAILVHYKGLPFLVMVKGVVRILRFCPEKLLQPLQGSQLYADRHEFYNMIQLDTIVKKYMDSSHLKETETRTAIICEVEGKAYCAPVDSVGSKGHFIVKALTQWMGVPAGVVGSAIIGDGVPVPVVDLRRLVMTQSEKSI